MASRKLNLVVKFGGLSSSDETTGRLSIGVARANLTIDDADSVLCGRRLKATIIGRAAGTRNGDQQSLPTLEESDVNIDGTFDVKKFSVTPSKISFSLLANLKEVEISTLAHFPGREGELRIKSVEVIESNGDEDEDDDEDKDKDKDDDGKKGEGDPPATRGRPRRKTEATA